MTGTRDLLSHSIRAANHALRIPFALHLVHRRFCLTTGSHSRSSGNTRSLCQHRKRRRLCIRQLISTSVSGNCDSGTHKVRALGNRRAAHQPAAPPEPPHARRPDGTPTDPDATTADAVSTNCLGLGADRRVRRRQAGLPRPAPDLLPAPDELAEGHRREVPRPPQAHRSRGPRNG